MRGDFDPDSMPASSTGPFASAAPDTAGTICAGEFPEPKPALLKAAASSDALALPSPLNAPSASRPHGVTFTPARTAEAAPSWDPLPPPTELANSGAAQRLSIGTGGAASAPRPAGASLQMTPLPAGAMPWGFAPAMPGTATMDGPAWGTPLGDPSQASLYHHHHQQQQEQERLRRLSGAGAGVRPAAAAAPQSLESASGAAGFSIAGPSSWHRTEQLRERYAAALAGGSAPLLAEASACAMAAAGASAAARAVPGSENESLAAAAPGASAAAAAAQQQLWQPSPGGGPAAQRARGNPSSAGAPRQPLRTLMPRPQLGPTGLPLPSGIPWSMQMHAAAAASPQLSHWMAIQQSYFMGAQLVAYQQALAAQQASPPPLPPSPAEAQQQQQQEEQQQAARPRASPGAKAAKKKRLAPSGPPRYQRQVALKVKRSRLPAAAAGVSAGMVLRTKKRAALPGLTVRRARVLPRLRVPSRGSLSALAGAVRGARAAGAGRAGAPLPVAITVTQNDIVWVPVPAGWGERLARPRSETLEEQPVEPPVPAGWGEQLLRPRWETQPVVPGWGEQLAKPRWETDAEELLEAEDESGEDDAEMGEEKAEEGRAEEGALVGGA